MLNNRCLTLAVLVVAALLAAGKSAQAQDYFFGYYYPSEHRFHSDELNTKVYDFGGYGPLVVGNKDAVTQPQPSPATVRLVLPDPLAKVWFDGTLTTSTGKVRNFTTPPLDPGTAQYYKLKILYVRDGKEIVLERTVTVLPGHTAVFQFSQKS